MKRRMIAATLVGVAAAATATLVAAVPSLAGSTTHTFTFIGVSTVSHNFDQTHSVFADNEKQSGKLIGTDSGSCVLSSTGKTVSCEVAAAYKAGLMYVKFTVQTSDGSLAGTVTGGTRKYAGATGTVSGTAISQTKERVTVTYHT